MATGFRDDSLNQLPRRRYICVGGEVVSPTDGQTHRVSPYDLPGLYGVDPVECVFADTDHDHRLIGLDHSKFFYLRPRSDGNYTLPEIEWRWDGTPVEVVNVTVLPTNYTQQGVVASWLLTPYFSELMKNPKYIVLMQFD
jgi:hypothetical protein